MIRWCVIVCSLWAAALAQPLPQLSVLPADRAANVPLNAKVLVRFTCCQANTQAIRLLRAGQPVAGRGEVYSVGANWIVFTPDAPLSPFTVYDVQVLINGSQPYMGQFTTGTSSDNSAIELTAPTPNTRYEPGGAFLTLRFSRPLNPGSLRNFPIRISTLRGDDSYSPRRFALSNDATELTIPSPEIRYGQIGVLSFLTPSPIEDWLGNRLTQPADILFSTYPETLATAMRVTQSVPTAGEDEVPTNSAIQLALSADLGPETDAAILRGIELKDAAGQVVTCRLERLRQFPRILIVRPAALLRGNQNYTFNVAALRDLFGNTLAAPFELAFRTAALPELRALQVVRQMPIIDERAALGATVRWDFSRAISELPGAILRSAEGTPFPLQVSPDRMALEQVPDSAIPPSTLTGRVFVYDRVTFTPRELFYRFTMTGDIDTTPPAVHYSAPTAGVEFPLNGTLRVALLERVTPPLSRDAIRLTSAGSAVTATITFNPFGFELKPNLPLAAGDYKLEVKGFQDRAGNEMAPLEIEFRAAPTATEPFQLVRSDPPDGALDVDRSQPLILEFNRPPNPFSFLNNAQPPADFTSSTTDLGLTPSWRFDGNRAIYTPAGAWPRQTSLAWSIGPVTDLAGQTLAARFARGRFFTANTKVSSERPRILSVPLALEWAGAFDPQVLAFPVSIPLDPASVSSRTVRVSRSGVPLDQQRVSVGFNKDRQSIVARLDGSFGDFKFVFTSSVLSFDGEPMEEFEAIVRIPQPPPSPPSNRPNPFLTAEVPVGRTLRLNDQILIYFPPGTVREAIEPAISLHVNGFRVPMRLEWVPDSSAAALWSQSPYPDRATVQVVVSYAHVGDPYLVRYEFNVEAPQSFPNPNLSVIRYSNETPFPTDQILEAEFDRDIAEPLLSTLRAQFVESVFDRPPAVRAVRIEQRSPRILRFTPEGESSPNSRWRLELRSGTAINIQADMTFGPGKTRSHRGEFRVVPNLATGPHPVDREIRALFPAPVNPLRARIQLLPEDRPGQFRIEWSLQNRLLTIRPIGFLRPSTRYSLRLCNSPRSLPRNKAELVMIISLADNVRNHAGRVGFRRGGRAGFRW